MGIFNRRRTPEAAKGVEISYADGENFTRNLVSVRTVTYSTEVYGTGAGTYSRMYRTQPAVRAAVDFLARNIGQLNPKVYDKISSTDRVELEDHPLAVLLHYPNAATTRYAHQRDTVADIAIYDRAYWRKHQRGRQIQIERISPAQLTPDTYDGRKVYRLPDGTEIPPSQLVIFHGYSPDGDTDGVSPLETLRRVLAEEDAATTNREGMWRNSSRLQGVIERGADAPPWSDDARGRFRDDWAEFYSGPTNAGKAPILEDGMAWKDVDNSPPADDYIEGRRLTYDEVAVAYGIPPSVLGMSQETLGNSELDHRQVYQDVLAPWLRMLQDEIELQLLPVFEPIRTGTYVEFNLAEKLRGAFEEQATQLVTAVGVPYMSVDEARARLNLPSIAEDWAKQPVQPLNVMYGGQPSVRVPTADPSTPGMAALPAAPADEVNAILTKHFERMARSGDLDNRPRWDRELTADLAPLLGDHAADVARAANAKALQGAQ